MGFGKISHSAAFGAGLMGLAGLILIGPWGLVTGIVVGSFLGIAWSLFVSTASMPLIPAVHIDRRDTWHCQEADGEMVTTPLVPVEMPGEIFLQDLDDLKKLLEMKEPGQQTQQLLTNIEELSHCFQTMQSSKTPQERVEMRRNLLSLWGKKVAIQLAPMADQNEEIRILRNEIHMGINQLRNSDRA